MRKKVIISCMVIFFVATVGIMFFFNNKENSSKNLSDNIKNMSNEIKDVDSVINDENGKDVEIYDGEGGYSSSTLNSSNNSKSAKEDTANKSTSKTNNVSPASGDTQGSTSGSNTKGNNTTSGSTASSSDNVQKEEQPSKPQVDLNAVDKTDPLYSSHLGRIQYSSYTECNNAGFQKSFEEGSKVKSFSCIEINSVGRYVLGYYLELRY